MNATKRVEDLKQRFDSLYEQHLSESSRQYLEIAARCLCLRERFFFADTCVTTAERGQQKVSEIIKAAQLLIQ